MVFEIPDAHSLVWKDEFVYSPSFRCDALHGFHLQFHRVRIRITRQQEVGVVGHHCRILYGGHMRVKNNITDPWVREDLRVMTQFFCHRSAYCMKEFLSHLVIAEEEDCTSAIDDGSIRHVT